MTNTKYYTDPVVASFKAAEAEAERVFTRVKGEAEAAAANARANGGDSYEAITARAERVDAAEFACIVAEQARQFAETRIFCR
jgi:hypothetical protein